MKNRLIAREGMRLIIPSFVLSCVLFFYHPSVLTIILGSVVFAFCLFCLFFFRNPNRQTNVDIDDLISSADGVVMEVREMEETEFIGGNCVRISIFMSPADVHVNRAPCSGRILKVVHRSGEFAVAFKKDIDKENERNNILIENKEGEKILVVQIAGFLARRIVSYVKETDTVEQGERIGMIAFGSRVDIYFPKRYSSVVKSGVKVKAGITVLATKKGKV
ncbi:MAG TPA: phosphatidylserine decarboxylase family protein [Syntrophorhabdaceae bacterium]|nr:phosphatidylserine decarboxylase family protein [Syntrophorhabdaceae bacterium]